MNTLKVSILIGVAASLVAVLLHASGIFEALDAAVALSQGLRPEGSAIGLSVLLAFGAAWISLSVPGFGWRFLLACWASVLVVFGSWVLSLHGKVLPPSVPVATIVVGLVLGAGWGRTRQGLRLAELDGLFGRRLPRGLFDSVVGAPGGKTFPGEVVNASVVVVSIHNHNELMELLPPESYTAMTNLYLETASDYLVESGGYLDECNGECVRVVFGAPIADERHAVRATRAAIDLAARLDELNKECDSRWQRRLDVRMGVDSGDVIAGVFGGRRLGSYSVAGPAVDFARRLCAAAPGYGSRILIGPETHEAASESIEVRPIEILKSAAGRRRVEIHELLAPKNGLSPERERSRDHFWTGVLHFRERQWDKAVDEFTKARITGIPDDALDFYLRRIEQERHRGGVARDGGSTFFHAG